MPKAVQMVRQATAVASTYLAPIGQWIQDLGLNTIRVHDGATPGGFPLLGAKNNLSDVADAATCRTNLGIISSTDQFSVASGTADALVAVFPSPYTVLTDGLQIRIRVPGANTLTNPTLKVDANAIYTVTKLGGSPLVAGDYPANLFEGIFRFNLANTRWELLNPASTTAAITTTATNDNAGAGKLGEYISSDVPLGAPVALTTGLSANMTSIALTAGDWDVSLATVYIGNVTTTVARLISSISLVSATSDITLGRQSTVVGNNATLFNIGNPGIAIPPRRISIAGPTTVYAVATAQFGVSTCTVFGNLSARRVR